MISLALVRCMEDPRLKPYPIRRLALVYLHGDLNYDRYAPVKVRSLAHGVQTSRVEAFRALVSLEQLGYIESDPTTHKPKHYRLRNPASLTHVTPRAA